MLGWIKLEVLIFNKKYKSTPFFHFFAMLQICLHVISYVQSTCYLLHDILFLSSLHQCFCCGFYALVSFSQGQVSCSRTTVFPLFLGYAWDFCTWTTNAASEKLLFVQNLFCYMLLRNGASFLLQKQSILSCEHWK